jgi:predicted kinase
MSVATLFLIVGLPGAGKTERAKTLAAEQQALRLTPDAWMIPLFGDPQPAGKRDVLEGRLVWLALEALRLGTSVVLDFGLWGRDERSSLRWLARSVDASCHIIYLPIDRETQIERIQHRSVRTPHETFVMTETDVDDSRARFEAPDAAELEEGEIPDPPDGWTDWGAWAAERWPTSVDGARTTRLADRGETIL